MPFFHHSLGASGNEMPVAYIPAMPNSNHVDSSNGLPAADGGMTIATPNSMTANGVAMIVTAKNTTTAKAGVSAASKRTATAKQKRVPKTANLKQKKDSGGGSRRRKAGTDPNQPKKPSNAFFWFCQEHRPGLQERFRGEGVQGQHDLTKILAKLWSETAPEDKKVCALGKGGKQTLPDWSQCLLY